MIPQSLVQSDTSDTVQEYFYEAILSLWKSQGLRQLVTQVTRLWAPKNLNISSVPKKIKLRNLNFPKKYLISSVPKKPVLWMYKADL